MISRIAPTPSGFLHWGNVYNFALTWNTVRKNGGKLWLRIDDADATRMRLEFVEHIFSALSHLGFDWDQGPRSVNDFLENHSQSKHKNTYFKKLSNVKTYACDCSRQQIRERTLLPYDGFCESRNLNFIPGRTALRLPLSAMPHPIVWTKDDLPAYLLASVMDDVAAGTTHIFRGEDLRETTEIQKKIGEALGESSYAKIEYTFHPLLLDADGKKLSKSAGSESEVLAEDAWRKFSEALNLSQPIHSLKEFQSS